MSPHSVFKKDDLKVDDMNISSLSRWVLLILNLILIISGCFEITGSDNERPCGDQLACPFPKQCVNQVCISQCLDDEDCQDGQACESLRCVPRAQENQALSSDPLPETDLGDSGGDMEENSNLELDTDE